MRRLSIHAIVTAFSTEILLDLLIARVMFAIFANGQLTPEMSDDEVLKITQAVFDQTSFLDWMFVFGSATTLGGAYLAARIAKRIPYYHGLAMGIVGLVFSLFFWRADAGFLNYLGLLITIPLSLYGSHLAKMRMRTLEIL